MNRSFYQAEKVFIWIVNFDRNLDQQKETVSAMMILILSQSQQKKFISKFLRSNQCRTEDLLYSIFCCFKLRRRETKKGSMAERYNLLKEDKAKYDKHRDITGFLGKINILELKVKNLELKIEEVILKL